MNAKTSLLHRTVRKYAARGLTMSVAESCTGGWLSKLITDVPGASRVLPGSVVAYSNEAKINLLGVDPEIIARSTEVSHDCAKAMADGARRVFSTDVALSTTGYAGPGGGTPHDPVGTVYIAVSTSRGTFSECLTVESGATRSDVRSAAVWRAIELLEKYAD